MFWVTVFFFFSSLHEYPLLDYLEISYKYLCLQSKLINRANTAGPRGEACCKHIQESVDAKWHNMDENQGKVVDKAATVHRPFQEPPADFQQTWADISL